MMKMKKTIYYLVLIISSIIVGMIAYYLYSKINSQKQTSKTDIIISTLNGADSNAENIQNMAEEYRIGPLISFDLSKLLKSHNLSVIPCILNKSDVYVQPFSSPSEEASYHFLGNDGNSYPLTMVSTKIASYESIDWGYGDSMAFLLKSNAGELPQGCLVVIGKSSEVASKWYPAQVLTMAPQVMGDSYWNSDEFIEKEKTYGLKQKIIYTLPNINEKIFYLAYKKIEHVDPNIPDYQFYKYSLILSDDSGTTSIVDSFQDQDGMPESSAKFIHLGLLLGSLEISAGPEKEIWFVCQGFAYETVGYTFIQYYPYSAIDENRYYFICTGGL